MLTRWILDVSKVLLTRSILDISAMYGRFMVFFKCFFLWFSLYIKVYQCWGLQRGDPTDTPKENGRKFAPTAPIASKFRLGNSRCFLSRVLMSTGARLSPTPSVSNLSLRPCRYLSTVTRSSSRGSVDGFTRERLQRFATFDSLSVLRRLEAR